MADIPDLATSIARYIVDNGQEQARIALANLLISLSVAEKQKQLSIETNTGKVTIEIPIDDDMYNPQLH